ncbi:hypothetical protein [Streptomyces sp. NPDC059816]|uniref:hypothetical protein n=1 Tax=Streptomyces sp. NPDC059816 TaxID=3346960 RepID=UPI003657FC51
MAGQGVGAMKDAKGAGLADAVSDRGAGPDTASARAAARRRAARREARVTAGAEELERRLADVLRGGLAAAEREGRAFWEETAARMVDAQAPGLASRARELAALAGSGPGWPVRMLEECALLHLLARGWLRRDALPGDLATTVRTRVGLPCAAEGEPVPDRWSVLAQYDTVEPPLTTRRIWVHGARSGRTALVLSYGAAGREPALSLPVGGVVEAAVVPYPGAGRSRVDLGADAVVTASSHDLALPTGVRVAEAVAAYGAGVAADPWAEHLAVTVAGVVPVLAGDLGQVVDPGTGRALPLARGFLGGAGLWRLISLAGGSAVTVFGELGHVGLRPLSAWARDGPVVSLT